MKKNFNKKSLSFILEIVVLAAFLVFSFHLFKTVYSVKTLPGLKIAGKDFGNLDKNMALWLLNKEVRDLEKKKVKIAFQDKTVFPSYEEIGLTATTEKTISEALNLSKEKNIFVFSWKLVKTLRGKENIGLQSEIDQEKLHQYLIANFSEAINPVQNATLSLEHGDFVIVPEKTGIDVNLKLFISKIKENIGLLKRPEIDLVLETAEPKVFQNETKEAYEKALAMARSQIILKAPEEKEFIVDPKEIKTWISFKPIIKYEGSDINTILGAEIDTAKVQAYLDENIKQDINREPENARFEKKDDKIEVFAIPQNGEELDFIASALKIKEALESFKNESELVVMITPPQITNVDTGGLVIKDFLGEGASSFAGSPKNRRYNIGIGVNKIHGLLVPDNEIFSMNKALGKVGPEAGYLPELVIKQNKTEPDFGGGLCQVSTTLFRAVVHAGLKIVEREPHAYIVRYYGAPGMDATIYQPSPDLKFLNDTGNPVLIQGEIKGNNAYFRVYGVSDNRKVKTLGPYTYDRKPDGSAKAKWTQEIYYEDKLVRSDTFLSSYDSADKYPKPLSTDSKLAKISELGKKGNALFAAGKYAEAKTTFEAILKLDPNHVGAKASLTIVNKKIATPKIAGTETKKE